jgi:hypothetical protein
MSGEAEVYHAQHWRYRLRRPGRSNGKLVLFPGGIRHLALARLQLTWLLGYCAIKSLIRVVGRYEDFIVER